MAEKREEELAEGSGERVSKLLPKSSSKDVASSLRPGRPLGWVAHLFTL